MISTGNPPRLLEVKRGDGGCLTGYHWPGPGPSLLLIPGSWSDYRQFDAVRAHLAEDLDLAILELPGARPQLATDPAGNHRGLCAGNVAPDR